MPTIITAGNATNGLVMTPDNTGALELKTGTGAGTTAVTISTAQAVTFAGAATVTGAATLTGGVAGNLQFNSGYGSIATAYGCRAWVNFNGTGTVAIRASGNVTSITDNGTGDYTVVFTTAMPDVNYATTGSCFSASSGEQIVSLQGTASYLAGSVRITTRGGGGSVNDSALVLVAVFR